MIQNFNGELIVHINKSKDLKIDLTLKIYNTKDVQVIANNASMVKSSLADGHGLDAVREIVMADGKPRLEEVHIYDPVNKTIAFKPFDEYLLTEELSSRRFVICT